MSDTHAGAPTPDLDQAIALHKSGNLREAARIYQQILDADPANARVWAMLSQVWLSRLLFQRSADCLQRAIAAEPDQFLYHFFLASPLRRLHRHDDALAALDRALALRPDHLDSHAERIAILEHLARDAEPARLALRAALPADPSALDTLALDIAQAPSRRALAIEILRYALTLDPASAQRHARLGELLAGARPARAADAYQRALELDPDTPGAAAALAVLCERLDRLDDARWYAGLALQRTPDDPELNVALARLDRRDGRLRDAAARLQALRQSPAIDSRWTYAAVLTELAWTLDAARAFDDAFALFSEAQAILAQRRAAQRHPLDAMRLWLDAVRERTSSLRPSTWRRPPAMPDPPVFLVSFFRAVPSPLRRALIASAQFHVAQDDTLLADILSSARAELNIAEPYPDMLDRLSDDQVIELRQRYLAHARADAPPDRPILDPHAMNLVRLPAIARLFPDARVVFDLDDPRDATLNAFVEQLAPNPTTIHFASLDNAARFHVLLARAYLAARALLDPPPVSLPVLEVRAESLQRDPQSELARVFDFLGMPMPEHALRALTPANAPSWGLTPHAEPPPSHAPARWTNYARHLAPALDILAPIISRFSPDSPQP